ncbi:DUF397 domain-containing protein [Streptomyces griseoaurantiacus]|uniref:DUF397 domain-containing protein n=1 Tax=Streptomyces griseoaurantiacus TaxID=68213 RepID=UPI0036A92938
MTELTWQKFSFSEAGGANCLHVAARPPIGPVHLRESDQPGTVLTPPGALAALIRVLAPRTPSPRAREGAALPESVAATAEVGGVCGEVGCGRMDDMVTADRLTAAAAAGDIGVLTELLSAGAAVDAVDRRRRTALDRAVWAERMDAVRLSVAAGADVEQPIGEYREDTPLCFAAGRGDLPLVRLLLDAGAEADGRRSLGQGRAGQGRDGWAFARVPGGGGSRWSLDAAFGTTMSV